MVFLVACHKKNAIRIAFVNTLKIAIILFANTPGARDHFRSGRLACCRAPFLITAGKSTDIISQVLIVHNNHHLVQETVVKLSYCQPAAC